MAKIKCSKCKEPFIGGSDGVWICPHCGNEMDRSISGRATEGIVSILAKFFGFIFVVILLPFVGIFRFFAELKNGNKKIAIFVATATIIAWVGLILAIAGFSNIGGGILLITAIVFLIVDAILKKMFGTAD